MGVEPLTSTAAKAVSSKLRFTGGLVSVMTRTQRLKVFQGMVERVVDVVDLVSVCSTTLTVYNPTTTVSVSLKSFLPNDFPITWKFSSSCITIPSHFFSLEE